MGRRYGKSLDGWFFDDGAPLYYPGRFEELAATARAGNPARLISYNDYDLPSPTGFQDVHFGEICASLDADVGGTGRYVRGKDAGLQGHCMFRMEQDWGVHSADTVIGSPQYTIDSAYALVKDSSARKVPVSFNLMMYEDGTVARASLDILEGLSARLKREQQ
jgi:hypothetical protein